MGKFNEIQQETTQSWGDNSFTTTVKSDTVEFDSAKDKFTFKDAVEVPSLSINGEPITPTEPQVQADWNQNDNTKADFVKNRTHFDTGITTQYVSESFTGDYSDGAEMPVPTSSSKYILRIKFDGQDKWEEHEITFSDGVQEYDSTYCDQTPDEYSPLIMLGGRVAVSVFYFYNYNSDDEHEIEFLIENSAYENPDDPYYGVSVDLEFGEGELKKLDPKFIPDTVVQKWELGGVIFRIYHGQEAYENYLQFSLDNGESWNTVAVAQ